jgi:hypothetical protein
MSAVLWAVDPGKGGRSIAASNLRCVKGLDDHFPSGDKYGVGSSLYRALATNIYKTAGRAVLSFAQLVELEIDA